MTSEAHSNATQSPRDFAEAAAMIPDTEVPQEHWDSYARLADRAAAGEPLHSSGQVVDRPLGETTRHMEGQPRHMRSETLEASTRRVLGSLGTTEVVLQPGSPAVTRFRNHAITTPHGNRRPAQHERYTHSRQHAAGRSEFYPNRDQPDI